MRWDAWAEVMSVSYHEGNYGDGVWRHNLTLAPMTRVMGGDVGLHGGSGEVVTVFTLSFGRGNINYET